MHSSHMLAQVMLKILQVRLQQYVNHEVPDVQVGFRKGRGTRDQIANICCIIKKAKEFQKNIDFRFIDYAKANDCVDHNEVWEILQEMRISDHLTCLLSNLYAGQKETKRDMEQQTGSKLGKEYVKAVYCHLYAEYIMQNAGLGKAQAGIKIARRKISVTSYTQLTPPLWEKAKRN